MRAQGLLSAMVAIASIASGLVGCGDDLSTASTGSTETTTSGGGGGQGGAEEAPFRIALSVSPFADAEFDLAKATFTDGTITATNAEELQTLYVAHGANEVFARLSTERARTDAADDHSHETALARAALAKKLGLRFNPEIGLWRHYGDITCQNPPDFTEYPEIELPGPWETLTADQMVPALHDYGAIVAQSFIDAGVEPNIWDIGNEVDFGTAGVAPNGINCVDWRAPDGIDPSIGNTSVVGLFGMSDEDRITYLQTHVWPTEARLLAAVADGIRSVVPNARVSTHISQSTNTVFAVAFYKAMRDGGFEVDELGLSYYPTASNAPPKRATAFKSTVLALQSEFGKPAFIAEFGYPGGPTTEGYAKDWTFGLTPYPFTPEGQSTALKDLASWAKSAGMSGIRYWAPELTLPIWSGFSLFEGSPKATARPGLDSIRDGIASPDAAAFTD